MDFFGQLAQLVFRDPWYLQ